MTDEQTPTNPGLSRATRRALLVAGGTAAVGAVAAAAASPAEAANGSSLILGKTNSSSAMTTINSTTPSGGAIHVANTGKGHASWFTSTQGNGFIGGTYSANAQGANCANYASTTGSGTGLTASGGKNTGVWGTSAGDARYAGRFDYKGATPAEFDGTTGGGGVFGNGLQGDGVVGYSEGTPSSFSGVTGIHLSGTGVFGYGFSGLEGVSDLDGGAGLYALADGSNTPATLPAGIIVEVVNGATDAIQATGAVRITGDLYVNGTIHTNHPVDTAWTPTAAKVARNAQRAATKARTSLNRIKP
jgi:hypothetical protein